MKARLLVQVSCGPELNLATLLDECASDSIGRLLVEICERSPQELISVLAVNELCLGLAWLCRKMVPWVADFERLCDLLLVLKMVATGRQPTDT